MHNKEAIGSRHIKKLYHILQTSANNKVRNIFYIIKSLIKKYALGHHNRHYSNTNTAPNKRIHE